MGVITDSLLVIGVIVVMLVILVWVILLVLGIPAKALYCGYSQSTSSWCNSERLLSNPVQAGYYPNYDVMHAYGNTRAGYNDFYLPDDGTRVLDLDLGIADQEMKGTDMDNYLENAARPFGNEYTPARYVARL
jgi:hypothetical protein